MGTEVLTPEVVEELPLDQVIDKTLVKNNVTEAVITAMKEKYGGMKLSSIDDKQGYIEIKEARKEVRKIGILTEKLCKAGREDAIKIQKLWLSKEKEILDKIDEVQKPLDAEIKRYEDEQERLAQLEIQRKEEQYMKRQTALLKMEARYEGSSFVLGDVSYDVNNIKEADEEIWNDTILPKFQREFAKVEAAKAEEVRLRKEAEEKLRAEQEELRKQQEEMQRQQAELQRQKEEADRKENERKQQEQSAEQAKRDAVINDRIGQLVNLGLNYSPQFNAYIGYGCNVDVLTELKLWNDTEWNDAISKIAPMVEEVKKKQEQERIAEIHRLEREKIEQEQKEAEYKRLQEEQRKAEELAQASDKEKWSALLLQIDAIKFPDFKSPTYKKKLAVLIEKIEEIKEL